MQQVIEKYISHLRREYPDAVAVILKGSHARGEAKLWSDIDFDVLVSPDGVEDYRTWIERAENRLIHISAAVESIDAWLANAGEPTPWSMGLPTEETTKLLWAATGKLRLQLDLPAKSHPAARPEVEDTVEALGKLLSAGARGDSIGVYRNAHKLATLIPTLLVPVNPKPIVSNSRQAIDAICSFPHVPDGFANDWLLCMGYVDERTVASTAQAAERMLRGILALLPPDVAIVGSDIARILADGTLFDYIAQDSTL